MNRIPDEKIKAIASEYLTNGMIKSKALQTVGYSKNYAEHGGLKLFDNDRLKNEITRQQAKIEKISEISVISEQQKLLEIAEDVQGRTNCKPPCK
jgi:phage terminase small subunit